MNQSLPNEFALAVIMDCRPIATSPWGFESWTARGAVCGRTYRQRSGGRQLIREQGETKSYLYPGLMLRLHKDEAESYYHNLMAPEPQLYVVARGDEDQGGVQPFHVTASFDEANAYMEADDEVFNVPLPPEVAVWMEQFVLTHYVPEPRKKRKRRDWRAEGRR